MVSGDERGPLDELARVESGEFEIKCAEIRLGKSGGLLLERNDDARGMLDSLVYRDRM